jgi:hypothetical protein
VCGLSVIAVDGEEEKNFLSLILLKKAQHKKVYGISFFYTAHSLFTKSKVITSLSLSLLENH